MPVTHFHHKFIKDLKHFSEVFLEERVTALENELVEKIAYKVVSRTPQLTTRAARNWRFHPEGTGAENIPFLNYADLGFSKPPTLSNVPIGPIFSVSNKIYRDYVSYSSSMGTERSFTIYNNAPYIIKLDENGSKKFLGGILQTTLDELGDELF